MSEPKKTELHSIESEMMDVKKSFIRGARVINNSIRYLAGKQLKEGDGRLMAIYRTNDHIIDRLDSED